MTINKFPALRGSRSNRTSEKYFSKRWLIILRKTNPQISLINTDFLFVDIYLIMIFVIFYMTARCSQHDKTRYIACDRPRGRYLTV
jgi:hypothetical protein